MKEIKLFQCEICGTQYNEKEKAKKCEKSHLRYVSIDSYRYRDNSKYPETLTVRFLDDEKIVYFRGKKL